MKWPTRYEAKPSPVKVTRADGTIEEHKPLTRRQVGQMNARAARNAARERAAQIREWDRSHGRLAAGRRRSLAELGQPRSEAGAITGQVRTPSRPST